MIPDQFEYFVPKTVHEALGFLSKFPDDAKVLAGGHSLIPQMKLRLAAPKYLVDIGRISELSYIREASGKILVGPMATHHALEASPLIRQKCSLISDTASEIGDVQVRNRGTIGGSLVHADPAADWPAAILALNAELVATGPTGNRTVKAADFFVDMLTTSLQPTELLTQIVLPILPARTGCSYLKVHQQASGFAIVGVAVRLTVDSSGVCQEVGIGITGVGSKAYRATAVEQALMGQKIDRALAATAAEKAVDGVEALADLHASAEYRLHLAGVYTRRAIEAALAKAT